MPLFCATGPSLSMLLLAEFFARCFRFASETRNNFLRMASQVPPRPLGDIPEALRASLGAAQLRTSLISSGQLGPDSTKVALFDAEKFLAFSLGTLEYALFPARGDRILQPLLEPITAIWPAIGRLRRSGTP